MFNCENIRCELFRKLRPIFDFKPSTVESWQSSVSRVFGNQPARSYRGRRYIDHQQQRVCRQPYPCLASAFYLPSKPSWTLFVVQGVNFLRRSCKLEVGSWKSSADFFQQPKPNTANDRNLTHPALKGLTVNSPG
jgi:hypothetical protein